MAGLHEGPAYREDLERALEKLGGEEGVRARSVFRRSVREASEKFRDAILNNPRMGPAEVRCYQEVLNHAVQEATIQFQATMNRFE